MLLVNLVSVMNEVFSLVNRNLYLFKNYSNYSSEYAGVDFIQLSSGSRRKGFQSSAIYVESVILERMI